MATEGETIENLKVGLRSAQNALAALEAETRDEYKPEIERLESVLSYLSLVLEATDARLLSQRAASQLAQTVETIVDRAEPRPGSPSYRRPSYEGWADELLEAAASIPVVRDRSFEQHAREAAANFARSSTNRLNVLKKDAQQLQETIAEAQESFTSANKEALDEVRRTASEFETRLRDLDQTLSAQRNAIQDVSAQHNSSFAEGQAQREAVFAEKLEEFGSRFSQALDRIEEGGQQRFKEIEKMRDESARLVGAIGVTGTAGRYKNEADDQKKIANRLRMGSLATAIVAVVFAFVVTIRHHPDTAIFAGKLAVSLLVAAIAGYLASQSRRHRQREERARSLQLDLTAFAPFVEPLPEDIQQAERVWMLHQLFARSHLGTDPDVADGPTPGHAIRALLQSRDESRE
jgi:hypothetical protein